MFVFFFVCSVLVPNHMNPNAVSYSRMNRRCSPISRFSGLQNMKRTPMQFFEIGSLFGSIISQAKEIFCSPRAGSGQRFLPVMKLTIFWTTSFVCSEIHSTNISSFSCTTSIQCLILSVVAKVFLTKKSLKHPLVSL